MSKHHLTEIPFSSLPLEPGLQQALKDNKLEFCTPIQAESLPVLLDNRDCAGQAQTGTGKTLAFLLACMQRLLKHPEIETTPGKPKVLILAPTRELALQIHKDAQTLVQHTGLKLAICYGGMAYEQQKSQFEQPVDILIGTPGRLIDFLKQKLYTLKSAQCLVLDEADRMFDMGFINDVRFMLRRLPPPEQRLSMLFSATMAQKVMELAYEHMNNAILIKIESDSPAVERIDQTMYHPANSEKIPLLLGLIKKFQPERAIIFSNTKHAATRVWEYLMSNGHQSALISGDIPQKKRESLLQKFHDGEYAFLVATDVASRGLHIPDVTHVFNYDLPDLGEDYVHRIGRTARAGNKGHAISFACEDYAMNMMDIESYIQRSVPNLPITSDLLIQPIPRKRLIERKPRPNSKPGQGRQRPHQGASRGGQNDTSKGPRRARSPSKKPSGSEQQSG
ncbi:MAG: DEAD/DEAH box helicase [Gammaproteobacteria bacterium]|nr:DEAD/DEAH box helicase [Gammaproteobacteria bacterium]MBL6999181.1 DEAD/DEAH box helicase [Gammaproteobacteria bacterium]